MIKEIIVPDIGENVVSGKVVAVHLEVGGQVEIDATVIELETDKAVVEIPSSVKGKVTEVLAREGEEMKVGDVIAKVETVDDALDRSASEAKETPKEPAPKEAVDSDAEEKSVPDGQGGSQDQPQADESAPRADASGKADRPAAEDDQATEDRPEKPVPASPSIRRMARELGVDLRKVQGSGSGGRISAADIKSYVKTRQQQGSGGDGGTDALARAPQLPDFSKWGPVETVEMETVRRLTAQSTSVSWQTIPHVTQFDEADITGLDAFIEKNAQAVAGAGGKLTVTAILTKVCAGALEKFPHFNASIDLSNERLILKKYVHIGIAVDTPRGLLMPVIRDADTKGITALAVEISDLAERARSKKIKSAELEGGTFSISNQGGIGGAPGGHPGGQPGRCAAQVQARSISAPPNSAPGAQL